MTVKELMERVGVTDTGKAIAYVKDALEEINSIAETHLATVKLNITKDKRFYDIPKDVMQIKDIRCKNHRTSKDEYRTIPRSIYKPLVKDGDGN